jgi:hypothetical protein
MTTIDLKNKVIHKINQIDDDEILNEVYKLIDGHFDDEDILELSANHKHAIEEAKAQIARGEFYTKEQANQEIAEWLNK